MVLYVFHEMSQVTFRDCQKDDRSLPRRSAFGTATFDGPKAHESQCQLHHSGARGQRVETDEGHVVNLIDLASNVVMGNPAP
jgi:hypothetical protein